MTDAPDPSDPLDPHAPHDWDAELAALLDDDEAAPIPRPYRRTLRIIGAVVLIALLVLLVLVPAGWLARRAIDDEQLFVGMRLAQKGFDRRTYGALRVETEHDR